MPVCDYNLPRINYNLCDQPFINTYTCKTHFCNSNKTGSEHQQLQPQALRLRQTEETYQYRLSL